MLTIIKFNLQERIVDVLLIWSLHDELCLMQYLEIDLCVLRKKQVNR